ncbi:hypothetical protein G7066_01445 [Leucobacter coleopterorum]|uniref:Uncharacterized protein n=1 Tax=Leucobacter coleopterorum TaxID=2714933 RepID=A0ABX6JUN7_9MICO|nr:hypothetical protein [Leucobacter coleopterorum]QIM17701.1 hypothetical protein G7066_01445 [Leucobacter coleopterorum]
MDWLLRSNRLAISEIFASSTARKHSTCCQRNVKTIGTQFWGDNIFSNEDRVRHR